jgi:hypothetical protein
MHTIGVLLELLGAFLLAAEAIKTANLVLLGQRLNGVAYRIRGFHQADSFSFNMTGNIICVLVLLGLLLLNINVPLPILVLVTLASTLSLLILTLSLEQIAKRLEWIERNTVSGVVGIAGFVLYVLGVVIRETL